MRRIFPGTAVALLSLSMTVTRAEQLYPELRDCVAGASGRQQQACDRQILNEVGRGSEITSLTEGWQLVTTRSPSGGPDIVSVMRIADAARSDIGLAGLRIQCSAQGSQIDLITFDQLARTDRPLVTFRFGNGRVASFEAQASKGGTTLQLPNAAMELANSDWLRVAEVSVEIGAATGPIRGTIVTRGLAAAMGRLTAGCQSSKNRKP